MTTTKIVWSTPNADALVASMARVSNPDNQSNPNISGILNYMMREGHVSPFEMVNACIEINMTRDIARQILRHRSFSFQEFSQRYADPINDLGFVNREARLQDFKNRQNSLETTDIELKSEWLLKQNEVIKSANNAYQWAISNGVAKEQARVLLPEGLMSSRMYMNGNLRSWIFYLKQRLHESTQKEHRLIAEDVLTHLRVVAPITMAAFFPN